MTQPDLRVMMSTVGSAERGREIATALVDERLVACVNVVHGIESHYRWQDRTCCEEEVLLILKTRASMAAEACRRLVELHPYEVPEVIELPVVGGSLPYLRWVEENAGGLRDV
jgi:periplasmic divalent cation tolerance protein